MLLLKSPNLFTVISSSADKGESHLKKKKVYIGRKKQIHKEKKIIGI